MTVTVNNPPVDTSGLVGAWGFEEGTRQLGRRLVERRTTTARSPARAGPTPGASATALTLRRGRRPGRRSPTPTRSTSSTAMTLEAWVHPTQHGGWRTALMKERSGGQLAYSLYSSAWSDQPERPRHDHRASRTRARRAELTVGTWSHLAVTYDGTTLRPVRRTARRWRAARRRGTDRRLDAAAAHRRQHDLGRVLRRPHRRGPRLPARAERQPRSAPTWTRR